MKTIKHKDLFGVEFGEGTVASGYGPFLLNDIHPDWNSNTTFARVVRDEAGESIAAQGFLGTKFIVVEPMLDNHGNITKNMQWMINYLKTRDYNYRQNGRRVARALEKRAAKFRAEGRHPDETYQVIMPYYTMLTTDNKGPGNQYARPYGRPLEVGETYWLQIAPDDQWNDADIISIEFTFKVPDKGANLGRVCSWGKKNTAGEIFYIPPW